MRPRALAAPAGSLAVTRFGAQEIRAPSAQD